MIFTLFRSGIFLGKLGMIRQPIVKFCRNFVSTPQQLGSQAVPPSTLPQLDSLSVKQLEEVYREAALKLLDRNAKMNEKKLRQMLHVNLLTSNQAINQRRPFIYCDSLADWEDCFHLSPEFVDFAYSRGQELKFPWQVTQLPGYHEDPGEKFCRVRSLKWGKGSKTPEKQMLQLKNQFFFRNISSQSRSPSD
jgi:hypothetical protein